MDIGSICVYGSDGRMDYVAQTLYHYGYDVCRDISLIDSNSVIIMPPPCGDKMMAEILPHITEGCVLYGGMVSNRFMHECELINVPIYDYLKWDSVTEQNAILTGKGIIKQAALSGAVIEGSDCLVTGYGFCGKALAHLLKECDADVDVMVRRKNLAEEIRYYGYGFVDMKEKTDHSFFKYSYIFNTVPAMVIDDMLIDRLSRNVMIFDIASKPGGTDFGYCEKKGIYAVNSLGIPGKEYPKEAGEIIANAVISDMTRR